LVCNTGRTVFFFFLTTSTGTPPSDKAASFLIKTFLLVFLLLSWFSFSPPYPKARKILFPPGSKNSPAGGQFLSKELGTPLSPLPRLSPSFFGLPSHFLSWTSEPASETATLSFSFPLRPFFRFFPPRRRHFPMNSGQGFLPRCLLIPPFSHVRPPLSPFFFPPNGHGHLEPAIILFFFWGKALPPLRKWQFFPLRNWKTSNFLRTRFCVFDVIPTCPTRNGLLVSNFFFGHPLGPILARDLPPESDLSPPPTLPGLIPFSFRAYHVFFSPDSSMQIPPFPPLLPPGLFSKRLIFFFPQYAETTFEGSMPFRSKAEGAARHKGIFNFPPSPKGIVRLLFFFFRRVGLFLSFFFFFQKLRFFPPPFSRVPVCFGARVSRAFFKFFPDPPPPTAPPFRFFV